MPITPITPTPPVYNSLYPKLRAKQAYLASNAIPANDPVPVKPETTGDDVWAGILIILVGWAIASVLAGFILPAVGG